MADLLLDTDVLIDVGRGVSEAIAFLDEAVRESVVARVEVIKFSEPITDLSVRLVGRYSLSHGLAIPDALIAATALPEHVPLATKNRRDYQFIRGLRLAEYP